MDVRVKMNPLPSAAVPPKQEILTGLPDGSLKNLLETLSIRHPELAPIIDDANTARAMKIYVNNSEVPSARLPEYFLRDGDTVSLFLKKKD